VHAGHQFYKCFGCGASGDVLKFVMEFEHVSFPEALKLLAERNGIPMPKRAEYATPRRICGPPYFRSRTGPGSLSRAARVAGRHGGAALSGQARRVAGSERAIRAGVCRALGPRAASPFGKARVHGRATGELRLAGRREDGSFYDRFRNRLMFPIHSESAKVIGFGGRALDPADEAKYLIPPNRRYIKRVQCFTTSTGQGRHPESGRSVLVEGYMDAIGVTAAGVREVVASCGTALTPQQVQALRRHSERSW